MRKLIFLLFLFVTSLSVYAQESKRTGVAVFDPTTTGTAIDEGTKVAIREIISSTIVNTGEYDIVERSLLEKVMKEQEFSNSGVVDDLQATEVGKLAGANKVVLSVVTLTGGRNMLSIKVIDVTTARVERQKVDVVRSGELLDIVVPLTLELLGKKVEPGERKWSSGSVTTSSASSSEERTAPTTKVTRPQGQTISTPDSKIIGRVVAISNNGDKMEVRFLLKNVGTSMDLYRLRVNNVSNSQGGHIPVSFQIGNRRDNDGSLNFRFDYDETVIVAVTFPAQRSSSALTISFDCQNVGLDKTFRPNGKLILKNIPGK